jgi:hypothetical protein
LFSDENPEQQKLLQPHKCGNSIFVDIPMVTGAGHAQPLLGMPGPYGLHSSPNQTQMKKIILLFSVLALAASWSCKKDNTTTPSTSNNNTTNTGVTINSSPQVTGKLDGVAYSKISGTGGVQDGTGSDLSLVGFPDTSSGKYSSFFDDGNAITYFDVSKGTLYFPGNPPSDSAFKAFFKTGTYYFSNGAMDGFVLSYYDASNTQWTTNGVQTGSFVITEAKEQTLLGYYYIKVKASFSCKFYDGLGNSKTFTDGVFVGYFCNQ